MEESPVKCPGAGGAESTYRHGRERQRPFTTVSIQSRNLGRFCPVVTGSLECHFASRKPLWPAAPLLEFHSHLLGSFCPLGPAGCTQLMLPAQVPHLLRASREWSSGVCVGEQAWRGATVHSQARLAAVAGRAAPGAGSVQSFGWMRRTASGSRCRHRRPDEGNTVPPQNLESPATADPKGMGWESVLWLCCSRHPQYGLGCVFSSSSSAAFALACPSQEGLAAPLLASTQAEGRRAVVLPLWLEESQGLGPQKDRRSSLPVPRTGASHGRQPSEPARNMLRPFLHPLLGGARVLVLCPWTPGGGARWRRVLSSNRTALSGEEPHSQ